MNKVIHRDWGDNFLKISLDLSVDFFSLSSSIFPVRLEMIEAYTPQDDRAKVTGWS